MAKSVRERCLGTLHTTRIRLPNASMLPPPRTRQVTCRTAFAALAIFLASALTEAPAQDRSWESERSAAIEANRFADETVMSTDLRASRWEADPVISAVLCFAVGFGACLLIVHCMLPALVHAQCIEIVREYVEHARREPDVHVVVLDRDGHRVAQRPRRVATRSAKPVSKLTADVPHHRRVDQPSPSSSYTSSRPTNKQCEEQEPGSMLSQIYEQNLQLRDQLRKQSRSVKP